MNSILITGAFGFVGKNLSQYLTKEKFKLTALDLQKQESLFYSEQYIWPNISEINFNNIDTIIHLAGKAHDTENTSAATEYFDINVGLTKRIFDQFLDSNAKIFIFFSSVKAVSDSVKNEQLSEEDIPNPKTPYGQSKLEAEKYILSQPNPTGKLIYILRPAMIHGPGNKGNLNLLYDIISKGIPYPLGAYHNQRSFTSIGNLNYIIKSLIEKKIPSGIYHVADSEALSTNEVIRLIALTTGRKPRICEIPKRIIKLIARTGDFISLPMNSERVKKLTENYVVSNKKLTSSLNVNLPFSANEGLKLTLQSFQEIKTES